MYIIDRGLGPDGTGLPSRFAIAGMARHFDHERQPIIIRQCLAHTRMLSGTIDRRSPSTPDGVMKVPSGFDRIGILTVTLVVIMNKRSSAWPNGLYRLCGLYFILAVSLIIVTNISEVPVVFKSIFSEDPPCGRVGCTCRIAIIGARRAALVNDVYESELQPSCTVRQPTIAGA